MLPLSPETLDRLCQHIQRLCGLVLTRDKAYLVQHRLEPLVGRLGLRAYEELCDRLAAASGRDLQQQVIEAITTHETSFFRDAHPFEALRLTLLPECVEAGRQRKQAGGVRPYVRIWCAGASTGQEPYSIAMLLHERLRLAAGSLALDDGQVVATDISSQVLAVAQAGLYPEREVHRAVPIPFRQTCFEHRGDRLQVIEPVRRLVSFRRANLLEPPRDLGQLDLVVCRNVLIYFDDATRRQICRTFHDLLAPGGVLLLGAAENLYGISDDFASQTVGRTVVYRKKK